MTDLRSHPWCRRLGVGQPVGRLFAIHGFHSAAEAMFAVSLAGSLFFSVSIDASRPRILLYLALTLAPFAVLGPLIGPFIDRVRGGHRIVLASTLTGRAVVVALLSAQVQSLWLYPLAFAILVLGRTYSVTRNALVPTLVPSNDQLVPVNSTLALVGIVSGGIGSSLGVAALQLGDAGWVLRVAVLPYAIGALLTLGLRNPERVSHHLVEDIVEIVAPAIRSASAAMAALRAAVGFVTFHLAFSLKSAGEPAWYFGVVLAANGVGGVAGTLLSPALRRRMTEHQMLTLGLATPAAVGVVTALRFHRITVVALSLAIGFAVSVGRRAFDSVVQTHAPHGSRGNAYATLETRLELSWVAGALAAVIARAAGWIGVAVLSAALGVLVVVRLGVRRLQRRFEELFGQEPLPRRLLLTAERLAALGDAHQATIMAAAVIDAAGPQHARSDTPRVADATSPADVIDLGAELSTPVDVAGGRARSTLATGDASARCPDSSIRGPEAAEAEPGADVGDAPDAPGARRDTVERIHELRRQALAGLDVDANEALALAAVYLDDVGIGAHPDDDPGTLGVIGRSSRAAWRR